MLAGGHRGDQYSLVSTLQLLCSRPAVAAAKVKHHCCKLTIASMEIVLSAYYSVSNNNTNKCNDDKN